MASDASAAGAASGAVRDVRPAPGFLGSDSMDHDQEGSDASEPAVGLGLLHGRAGRPGENWICSGGRLRGTLCLLRRHGMGAGGLARTCQSGTCLYATFLG